MSHLPLGDQSRAVGRHALHIHIDVLDAAPTPSRCWRDLNQLVQRQFKVRYLFLGILDVLEVCQQASSHGLMTHNQEIVLRALHLQYAWLEALDEVVVRLTAWIPHFIFVCIAGCGEIGMLGLRWEVLVFEYDRNIYAIDD